MSFSSQGSHSSRARRSSLPEFSDDSRSRSELPTTESSPARSNWTDTLSSDPKSSLPQDPPDQSVRANSPPTESVEKNVQKLVVTLPPKKDPPKKDPPKKDPPKHNFFGLRRKSKSLELIVVTKPQTPNGDNNTSKNGTKDKVNKTKNKIKAVFSGLRNSNRNFWANAKPVSSVNLPSTSQASQTCWSDETSVSQSVAEKVAAQVARGARLKDREKKLAASRTQRTQESQTPGKPFESESSNQAYYKYSHIQVGLDTKYQQVIKDCYEDRKLPIERERQRPPPPPPAPPDPQDHKRKFIFYIRDDDEHNDFGLDNHRNKQHRSILASACIDSYTPINLEGGNTVGAKYSFQTLPDTDIDSQYDLRKFEPQLSKNVTHTFRENKVYVILERPETADCRRQSPEQHQPLRRLPEVGRYVEERKNLLRKQLQEEKQEYEEYKLKSRYNEPPSNGAIKRNQTQDQHYNPEIEHHRYTDANYRQIRNDRRSEEESYEQSPHGAIKRYKIQERATKPEPEAHSNSNSNNRSLKGDQKFEEERYVQSPHGAIRRIKIQEKNSKPKPEISSSRDYRQSKDSEKSEEESFVQSTHGAIRRTITEERVSKPEPEISSSKDYRQSKDSKKSEEKSFFQSPQGAIRRPTTQEKGPRPEPETTSLKNYRQSTNSEKPEEESFVQSPHGAIRRTKTQERGSKPASEIRKRKEEEEKSTGQSPYGAVKGQPPLQQRPLNEERYGEPSSRYNRKQQPQSSKQPDSDPTKTDRHKQQYRQEPIQTRPEINQQFDQSQPSRRNQSETQEDVSQSNQQQESVQANSFWRREFNHQRQLDSPEELDDTHSADSFVEGASRLYREFCERYYRRNSPHSPHQSSAPYRREYPLNFNTRDLPREYFESPPPEERVEHYPSPQLRRRNSPKEDNPGPHMGRMGSLEDHERKVIIEFCHLLEKSKQLFNGLRELPQYGHKQWHSYFGRTFDVYTKLWKFQQQHRAVLDSKYGLKRWQIGEIASKIGQLYYHFYLRTSETAYLNEAFSFYYAIRGRSYYTKACKEDKCELMVKKLRYYARFIVVCLLLKKVKLVRELIKELDRQIIEYGNTYDPDDQIEWTVVVDEVKAFIQAEPVVSVIHPDNYPVILSHRLSPLTTPPVERSQQMNLSLQEVLIIGSSSQQVKFSELTMDMFRMLQTLEREPTGEIQHMYDDSPRQRFNLTPSALNNKGYNLETGASRSENPHKYLLFKPSPSQILVYLASGCNDLPPNGALLLYISADGQIVQPSKHPEDIGYDIGGLITTSKNDLYRDGGKDKASQAKNKELQCFHPGDLYPFTRRPLFIIVDSDNSYVFQNIPRHFGQPMIILMSPLELPTSLHVSTSDRRQQGSLFTLFLHSPLTAFCYCCDIHTISLVHWDRAQAYIDTFLAEASQIVTRSRIDVTFLNFMGDDFLRLLILRFFFCEVVLRMHRAFRNRTQLTRSTPPIPDDLLEHPALTHIVMDLASHLQVRGNFHDPSASGPPPSKE